MLKLIDEILHQFRICFKREETFNWFVIIVFGMLLRTEMRGISNKNKGRPKVIPINLYEMISSLKQQLPSVLM